jgi:EmrB/QacA subfamily drug resistance transporter
VTRPNERTLVSVAMLGAVLLTAMSTTIVATAAPSIVRSLEGIELYSWVFSGYLLTMTVTTPLYGKLADIYGRKPIFMVGIGLFLLGSLVCGLATTMEQLVLFRLLQGVGAGAVHPIALILAGDLFPLEQRARIQGFFSGMWALSSLLGPLIGGFIVATLPWQWVFWVNVPAGIGAALLMGVTLRETVAHRRDHQLDWAGAAAVAVGVSAFLVALFDLSGTAPGNPFGAGPLLVVAAVALAFFLWWERRAPEPLLSLDLFRVRVIAVGGVLIFIGGLTVQALTSYSTLFVQGVLGGTPVEAGLALLPMDILWMLGAGLAGRLILRFGYRATVGFGMTLAVVGSFGLAFVGAGTPTLGSLDLSFLGPKAPILVFALVLGITGLAFACIIPVITIAVQNAVDWGQRGVATATNIFFQTIGRSVGVAVLGVALNVQLLALLGEAAAGGGTRVGAVGQLLEPTQRAALAPAVEAALQNALQQALHGVWVLTGLTALVGLLIARLMPGGRAAEHVGAAQGAPAPAPEPPRSPQPEGAASGAPTPRPR